MKLTHEESRIPQFYDVLTHEIEGIRFIYQQFLDLAKPAGFEEIQTTAVELRERYLNATQVHPSKIFEVHRVKEKTRYALQADLAMSMSRFVADLDQAFPLKLIQMGRLYRDRIPQRPGYRREFQQIVLGTWGLSSLYADAEILALTCQALNQLPNVKVSWILLANHHIFNVIHPSLAEKIRFEGVAKIAETDLLAMDQQVLLDLYQMGAVDIETLRCYKEQLQYEAAKKEMDQVLQLADLLRIVLPEETVCFSLRHLEGTGHYSGFNYEIFVQTETQTDLMVCDGGRIDTLCSRFNKKTIPAVCMGIGVSVLAQFLPKPAAHHQIVFLLHEDTLTDKDLALIHLLQLILQPDYIMTVMPLKENQWRKIFRSDYYANSSFMRIQEGKISLQTKHLAVKKDIEAKLAKYHLLADKEGELSISSIGTWKMYGR